MSQAVVSKLNRILGKGGIRAREVADLLGTTPETVSRWRAGKVAPQSERLKSLLTLEWLISELATFYDPDHARVWIYSPHKLLGGKTPAECIREGKIDDVRAVIAQLEDGAFS
jgi:transcriptional regulator with XRE-family HTH domain